HEEAIPAEPRPYRHPRVSPDGSRIAVEVEDPDNTDIWIGDSTRGMFTRLTRGDFDSDPLWSPDGSRIVFTSVGGSPGLFQQSVDGGGMPEHVADGSGSVRANSWTPDGKLLFEELAADNVQVLTSTSGSSSTKITLFDAPEYFNERLPALSPDGRWLAYQSTESGKMEIYVRPFPNVTSSRSQISTGGGYAPLWSRDGQESFYRNSTSVVGVKIGAQVNFVVVSSSPLFNLAGYVLAGTGGVPYDVARDGRFLMLKSDAPGDSGSRQDIVVVQNWLDELKQLVQTR